MNVKTTVEYNMVTTLYITHEIGPLQYKEHLLMKQLA